MSLHGGGVFWTKTGGTLTIEQTTFSRNYATGFGGGVDAFVEDGSSLIRESTVSENTAGLGGGIFLRHHLDGPSQIMDSTVSSNHASGTGGGVFARTTGGGNRLEIFGSTVSHNHAFVGGGARLVSESGVTGSADGVYLMNSTVSGNTTDNSAGGVLAINHLGFLQIAHSTLSQNVADLAGVTGGVAGGLWAVCLRRLMAHSCSSGETRIGNRIFYTCKLTCCI